MERANHLLHLGEVHDASTACLPRQNGHPVLSLAAAITRVGGSSEQVDFPAVAEGKQHVVHFRKNLKINPINETNRVQNCDIFECGNSTSSDEWNVRFVDRHE